MASMVHDGGEAWLLKTGFSDEKATPTNFYLMLYNDTPAETDGIADLASEPSGSGYARQPIASNNTDCVIALDSGDYQCTFKEVTYTASGGVIGPVTHCALVTVETGTAGDLIASWALSTSRTLQSGDSLKITTKLKVQ